MSAKPERITQRKCVKCKDKVAVYWSARPGRGEKFVCPQCVWKGVGR